MELPGELEEILSDDYEEGEILDGDNLYEEVSSLEELSSGDEEQSQLNNSSLETDKLDSSSEKLKQNTKHRRKDHKCKENSVCRKERKGKHCYARIRKAKSSGKNSSKHKTSEAIPQSTVERVFPRKPDVTPIIKHLKFRPASPYKTRPDPPPKIPHRYDYKDYHEKENRYSNKRFWAAPPRNKMKQPDKHVHYNRSKVNNHYSKSRYQLLTPPTPKISSNDTSKTEPTKSDNSSSKTSLLKRLVGSGAAGVKPIKENEPPIILQKSETLPVKTISAPDAVTVPPAETEDMVKMTRENNEEADSTTSNGGSYTEDTQKSETQPEPPKKVEVKWIRSIKDDKDELHLRVEALRSAWIKKFNDRKKKGLIHQKRSDDVDDFLEDFAFSSDVEEKKNDEATPAKSDDLSAENKCVPCFNATDISGDILKPEDMVIVNDRTNEEPIISETAVTTTEGNSSVFVDPLFFSGGHFPTNICQVSSSNGNVNLTVNEPDLNSVTTKITADLVSEKNWKQMVSKNNAEKKEVTPVKKFNESCPQGCSQNSNKLKSKKSRWKKRRKSKGSVTEVGKNVSNICADFDDEISYLRQLALLSVKSKNRNSVITRDIENENDPKGIEKELSVQNKPVDNTNNDSESTGVRSSDNWEDDLDEDILRAKLLSSLTKQVSGNSVHIEKETGIEQEPLTNYKNILLSSKTPKSTINLLRPPSSKKQMMKKLDRRKLKNTNKKVWKQSNVCIKKPRLEANITINRFGKSSVFKKSEKTIQHNNHPPIMRPIPQVPQMIITVDDSDSSSDLDTSNPEIVKPSPTADLIPADIEANIDLLLREAELNSQIDKGIINTSTISKPDDKEESVKLPNSESIKHVAAPGALQTETKRSNIKTPTSTSSSSSCSSVPTPQALKHLPAWQQEEYKRLKKKIAEKEKVLQVTRAKIIEPIKDINANNPVSSEGKVPLILEANIPTSNCSVSPVTVPSVLGTESSILTSCSSNEKATGCINTVDNVTTLENLTTSEGLQNSEVEVSKVLKVDKACSVEENNTAKKSFPNLVSCSIMEEINVMNDVVNDFEKNNSEYMDLKQKMARLKRILKATESKMTVKKKRMFQIRDTITEKERQISSKIATFFMTSSSSSEKNKPPSRDMELVKLKYKEVSLRAQFLFHDFLSEKATSKDRDKKVADNVLKPESKGKEIVPTGVKRTSSCKETSPFKNKITVKESIMVKSVLPVEKAKDHIDAPMKRNFSGKEREREEWDPNTPVCHYDLNGICRDEECQYQHFKTV